MKTERCMLAGALPSQKPIAATPDVATGTVWRQLKSLIGTLGTSPLRRRLAWLAIGIGVVICVSMVGQVRLNAWQGDFFDALEQRDLGAFGKQVLVFLVVVAGLLTLVVAETWLREMLEVRLREWLTHDLLDRWLVPTRAYLLALTSDIGVNPDQRMQADALRLTQFSVSLSIGLLRASLLLVSFLGVLWLLSSEVVFALGESSFTVPGYFVWCALIYASVGSWLTWRIGRPLIGINAERYAHEAELRFALVRISEYAEAISVHGGEMDERRALDRPVERVVQVTRRLANGLARLTWITSGYGWLALLVPILVAAPGYFHGTLSFGELMMTIGAFNQVEHALRWFVDSFPQIADWRATLRRVVALHEALPKLEAPGHETSRIRFVQRPFSAVAFENLSVTLSDGCIGLDRPRVELAPGDRLLITGEPGADKSVLFRAMAGVWPWGSGTVHLPPREAVMFVPQRPYLPLGSLRDNVTYPAASKCLDDDAVCAALERVGLDHLMPALDREKRWDKELNPEHQQRLVLARLLLHRPQAVFFDEVMSLYDRERHLLTLSIFERELADTTVVNIGGGLAHDSFYNRTVSLIHLSDARSHRPRPRLVMVQSRPPAAAGFADGHADALH
jgi:vitamin B12/bleomycin/antimicrobial peptide transport system ATP-binding/permease protein